MNRRSFLGHTAGALTAGMVLRHHVKAEAQAAKAHSVEAALTLRELGERRKEVTDMLNVHGHLLTRDQQNALHRQLVALDRAIEGR